MAEWILVLALGLAAGTVGGVIGFGTSIMLMPALVWAFGPREAVPIMAVMMRLATNRTAMAGHTLSARLQWLGWLATAVMAGTVLATWLTG